MISYQGFYRNSSQSIELLRQKSPFVNTFTGDARSLNKSFAIMMKGADSFEIDSDDLLNTAEPV
jgi:hypothetical protein